MNILIIGCGYVGCALALSLGEMGHHITVTTRTNEKVAHLSSIANEVKILEASDPDALREALAGQDIAIITVAAGSVENYEKTYLGTAKAISQATAHLPALKQIIYTSSTSVYGDHQGAEVDENTPTSPQHPSGKILVETEDILLSLSSPSLSVCILRLGEIIGPGRNPADRLRRMQGIPLPGDGSSIVNWVHLDDIVYAVKACVAQKLSGVYNLCRDDHPTRKEFYDKICREENLAAMEWDPTKISIHSGNKKVCTIREIVD